MPDTAVLPPLSALILAGGAGSRMGGRDKGLLLYQGQPMIAQVCQRLPPQVQQRVISCNRHLEQYAEYGEVVRDQVDAAHADAYAGPLAGLISALPHCQHPWVIVMPCDMVNYPTDFAQVAWTQLQQQQLQQQLDHHQQHQKATQTAALAVAHDGTRRQNLCLLLHQSELPALQQAFSRSAAVRDWLDQRDALSIAWPNADAFCNINHSDSLNDASGLPPPSASTTTRSN